MRASRGAPHLQPDQAAEDEQRLTNGADGTMDEHALASLHLGCAVRELVRGRPAQDQRGRLGCIDACRHASYAVGAERAIGGVGADHSHVGHAVISPTRS
jgi:hypothetical protein